MSIAIGLMAAMLIDALTPKEMTVYLVGAALAPAIIIWAVLYHLRLPLADLLIALAVLWLASVMAMEWITPKPLSHYFIAAAIAPSIMVGIWLHATTAWRRKSRAEKLSGSERGT
ncbi:MAG: hypothetical protein PS018_02415 [bacterium]|nr:hypothetical protein [bacterium]